MDASLERDMSDIRLRSLKVDVEYKPELLAGRKSQIDLPAFAVVDVMTPRQHWRNTHIFSDYKSFSTGAQQGSSVKIIPDKNGSSDSQAPASLPQVPEKSPRTDRSFKFPPSPQNRSMPLAKREGIR